MRSPITVFTKPWKTLASEQLAALIAELGFDGVELPIREGFQVEPENIESHLVETARAFNDAGLKIFSIAGDLDEKTVRACGAAGVPILRTMLKIESGLSYFESVERFRSNCSDLAGALEESKVRIGLQNHCEEYVSSSIGIMHAIEPIDSNQVSAVLDLGHTGLEGELEETAIDIAWSRLSMINLKNAIRYSDGEDANGATEWKRTWVPGKEGFTSWKKAMDELKNRKYTDPICLTAEYRDSQGKGLAGNDVIPALQEDLTYLKQLLGED
ncbi:MAG: xylose isomerase [Crocinitomicaceae bacterium]|nr:xylose isomerase [Crocinitomicaceae bacterium]